MYKLHIFPLNLISKSACVLYIDHVGEEFIRKIKNDTLIKSFEKCGISNSVDGTENVIIFDHWYWIP